MSSYVEMLKYKILEVDMCMCVCSHMRVRVRKIEKTHEYTIFNSRTITSSIQEP
jgi:hypothetical protein